MRSLPAPTRLVSLLALAGAMALALLLAMPTAAQAHDTLLESDPTDGDVLETSPEELTFSFSADILDVSPVVRISDADGETVAEITPTIEGPVATATLPEPLAAGDYEIAWRVVSSDGHPIEGTFAITVEQDTAAEPDESAESEEPAASDDGGATAAETTGDTAASDAGGAEDQTAEENPAAQTEDESAGGLSMPLLLGILGVVVVGAVIAGVVIVRHRD